MRTFVLWLINSIVFVPLVWPASVTQRTQGQCSPAVADVKGNVTVQCTGVDPGLLNQILALLNQDLRRAEQFQKQVLDAVASKALDTKTLEEIIALKYKVIFNSSEENAKRWAKEFLDSPAKEQELKSLANNGQEFADKLRLRWQPFYDFILKEFDDRISELSKRNLLKPNPNPAYNPYYKSDAQLVVVDKGAQHGMIRDVRFKNGGVIQIFFSQGQIHGGILRVEPRLYVTESVNGAGYKPLFFNFYKDKMHYNYFKELEQGNWYELSWDQKPNAR